MSPAIARSAAQPWHEGQIAFAGHHPLQPCTAPRGSHCSTSRAAPRLFNLSHGQGFMWNFLWNLKLKSLCINKWQCIRYNASWLQHVSSNDVHNKWNILPTGFGKKENFLLACRFCIPHWTQTFAIQMFLSAWEETKQTIQSASILIFLGFQNAFLSHKLFCQGIFLFNKSREALPLACP